MPLFAVIERLPAFDTAREAMRGRFEGVASTERGRVADLLDAYRTGLPPGRPRPPAELPSTLAMRPEQLIGPLPVLSVVADQGALHDPRTGIIPNRIATGRDWERMAWASLFEEGRLVTGAAMGLRAHGDSTRREAATLSFRMHFRPEYRSDASVGARLLDIARPAAAVVLRNPASRGAAVDAVSFDLGGRMGALVPAFRPVRFYLNGEAQGAWTLTERVMPDGWGLGHFGHADFFMYVPKGEVRPADARAYGELVEWTSSHEALTLAQVGARIDVDNFARHLLAIMFLGTTDWAQGSVVQDRRGTDRRWRWQLWDLDQSLTWRHHEEADPASQPVSEIVFLTRGLARLRDLGLLDDAVHVARHREDLRRQLLLRLADDPGFRALFLRITSEVLNHRLTGPYLRRLPERYRELTDADGLHSGVDLRAFLRDRPGVVRRDLGRRFDAGAVHEVRVRVPRGTRLLVDGFPYERAYRGRYYEGQSLVLESDPASTVAVTGWRVDGRRSSGSRLELAVGDDLEIAPILASDQGVR